MAILLGSFGFLPSERSFSQSALPTLTVRADAQTKLYGALDPVFTYQYAGFTNGDTASAVSGQPALAAPQRVQNLWQFTESLPTSTYSFLQFQTDGTSQGWNGVQLSHLATVGNFYSSVWSSISGPQSNIVIPGMQYLMSFYGVSNSSGNQLYWHRYLVDSTAQGWGPTAFGSDPRRIVFTCVGVGTDTLDCGEDPTIPLGSGNGSESVYWLFLGKNNAFGGLPSDPNFQASNSADLRVGGFQIEPIVTEKRGVVVMGDSLTQYDCTDIDRIGCTSWTSLASALLNVPFYNRGIGSQTCAQILARWPTDASPILAANAGYAIIFCGTNDIGVPLGAPQIEQSISAMYAAALADGATPVVVTIGPFATTVAMSSAEDTRQSVNAWIRATYPLVLDFDRVNADPNNPLQQNPAYLGDGTHLNLAGRIAEGSYVAQSIPGNTQGYPSIWKFQAPAPYQPVLGPNPSNGMDFSPNAQREVGSYVILPSAGTLSSSEYKFSFSSALLNVTPAPLTVSANNKTTTYGDTLPAFDGTLSGALPADDISSTYSTSATSSSLPGTYAIVSALADPKNRLTNYIVTQEPGTLTILAAPCATPAFSVSAGTYASVQSLSITDGTPGATIYYSTDSTPPTSNIYRGPIMVSSSETIEAIATAPGYSASTISTAAYTIVPPPAIASLSPALASAGSSGFTLIVNGSAFGSGAVVHWAGNALATQFVSATSLTAQVPASDIASSGTAAITVQPAITGEGQSNPFQFEIDSSPGSGNAPVFTTINATVSPGSTALYPVTLPSTATNVTLACLNLPAQTTCSYSHATGVVSVATSSITPAGTYQIVAVFTETLPGAASALAIFPVFLIPLFGVRRRRNMKRVPFPAFLILAVMLIIAMNGCGVSAGTSLSQSPQSHQVTSSATVTLTVH